MKRITRFTTLAAACIVLAIGPAVGAVVTHEIGAELF